MTRLIVSIVVSGLLLTACSPSVETKPGPLPTPDLTETSTPAPTPTPAVPPAMATLPAGKYCYFAKSDVSTEGFQLDILDDGTASANYFGTIHNEAAAYYAAFETQLSNGKMLADGSMKFEAVTEVDGDTQFGEERWTLSVETASSSDGQIVLNKAECATLLESVWPQVE